MLELRYQLSAEAWSEEWVPVWPENRSDKEMAVLREVLQEVVVLEGA